MNDKTINLLLTLAAIGFVVYGIYNMTTKKDKDTKKDTETKEEVKFNYKKELDLVDNFVLDEDFKFDNNLKMRIAMSNIDSSEFEKTKASFNDINFYEFSGYYLKTSILEDTLKNLFGKGNYTLKSFYYDDSYYLYDKKDKCFYIFYSTLVTNCANSGEVVMNCIDMPSKVCEPKYSNDNNNIKVEVECYDMDRQYIQAPETDEIKKYSYEYMYSYDKKENDYYISDIKLIEE